MLRNRFLATVFLGPQFGNVQGSFERVSVLSDSSLNNKRFRFIISLSRGTVFPGNSVAHPRYRGHSSFLFLLCRPQRISSSPWAWLLIVAGQLCQFQATYPHTVIPWVEKTDHSFLILFTRKTFSRALQKTSPYISQAGMTLHGSYKNRYWVVNVKLRDLHWYNTVNFSY